MKVLLGLLLFFAVIGYFRTRALARSCSPTASTSAMDMGHTIPEAPAPAWTDDDDEQQQESEEDFLARERAMHHAEPHTASEPFHDGDDNVS